ncbi:MFS transporter [Desulfovirgula thermocuniculi]|uniref:MFS transporter n=1 Tax=Desulfovirgula thermocuniculi TaxID=348842 RepID=UPI000427DC6E|nr:MFS transporter [Desulfovirgula thermocuniculi]
MKKYVSEVVDELGMSRFVWKVYLLVGLAMIFDGFDYMIVSYTMPQISKEWALTKVQTGSLASWSLLGLIFGGMVAGILSDRIGRKRTLILSCVLYSLFTIPIFFAQSYEMFAIFRVLSGFGLGACIPVSATINSEFAPSKYRGFFIASSFSWLVAGWVMAGLVAMAVVPHWGWRYCYLIGGLPILYALILAALLPESPHWLVSKGRNAEAVGVIRAMERAARGSAREWSPEGLLVPPPPKSVGVAALFSREYRLATVGLWIMYFMGCVIIYGVTAWMPTLLYEKGLSLTKSYGFAIMQNAASIVANGVAGLTSDKMGRKKNIIFSFIVCTLAVVLMANAAGTLGILAACIFLGFASNLALTSVQPLIAETYRTEFRNTGVAWTHAFGRIGGFLAPIMAGYVQQLGIGFTGTMLWFIMPSLIGAVAPVFFVRYETRGKSLESIIGEFSGKAPDASGH